MKTQRFFSFLFFILGVGILAGVFSRVGWPALQANLTVIGNKFLFLVAIYLLAELAFTMGWWALLDEEHRQMGFLPVFQVFLAGDTVNYFFPAAIAGGEVMRAHLLRDAIGTANALPSVIVHKFIQILSMTLLLIAGVFVTLFYFALPRSATVAVLVILGGMVLFTAAFLWRQRQGLVSPGLRWLAGTGLGRRALEARYEAGAQVDSALANYYQQRTGALIQSFAWCSLGWCGGFLETWLILKRIGLPANPALAISIESLVLILNNAFFFIPGRVGSSEGVRVGVFVLLGLPSASGLAYGVVRRGREVAWALPGLIILVKRKLIARPFRFSAMVEEVPVSPNIEVAHSDAD